MPKLYWRAVAQADLERLILHLYRESPAAALSASRQILTRTDQLEMMPKLGYLIPDKSERREMIIPFGAGSYVIRYRLDPAGNPVILRIWHSREHRFS